MGKQILSEVKKVKFELALLKIADTQKVVYNYEAVSEFYISYLERLDGKVLSKYLANVAARVKEGTLSYALGQNYSDIEVMAHDAYMLYDEYANNRSCFIDKDGSITLEEIEMLEVEIVKP